MTARRCSVWSPRPRAAARTPGRSRAYSEGLDAAVACHDYPQVYDMTAPPRTRLRQYAAALTRRTARHPHTYGPFTVREYARSDWQYLDWCTRWPTAAADNPARPPRPRGGHYSRVPTLVLSGELDSITTPAEGAIVARQFPRSKQIHVANSFHVTAVGDTDDCAVRILRRFVRTPSHWPRHGCAAEVPPVRTMGIFPRTLHGVPAGSGRGSLLARRVAPAAAATVADLIDRWWNNYSGHSRRAARRHVDLHRRPHHGLPPARRTPHARPGGQRHRDLDTASPTG